MVVLTGPMFSLTAKNKFGKAIVYLTIKGQSVARMLLSPVQPRPPSVMNMRLKMKGLGKVSKAFTPTSTLKADIVIKTPSPAVWNGYWVGVAIKQFVVDNDAFDAIEAEYIALAAGVKTAWATEGTDCGIVNQTLTVEGKSADHPVTFENPLPIYLLAKACWYLEVLDEGDVAYTNPSGWVEAAIAIFGARILD